MAYMGHLQYKAMFEVYDNSGVRITARQELPLRHLPWSYHPKQQHVELKNYVIREHTDERAVLSMLWVPINSGIEESLFSDCVSIYQVLCGNGSYTLSATTGEFGVGAVFVVRPGDRFQMKTGENGAGMFLTRIVEKDTAN